MKARFPQRLLLVSALAAAWVASVSAVAAGPTARTGDGAWVGVRTKNFLVLGRGREREVRREAARLEQFHAVLTEAFARMVGGARGGPYAPTTVILFPDDKSYAPFKPVFGGRPALGVAGHFQSGTEVNYIALSLESERAGDSSSSTLLHEYTHLLVNDYLRGAPAWLKEGLAEYYSTARIAAGRVTLGGPLKARQQLLRRDGLVLPLDALFAAHEHSPLYQEDAKRARFYSEAWALVHYLLNGGGDARRAQFARYLDLVSSGADAAESWRAAFGPDHGALEGELAAYFRLPEYPVRVETFEHAAASEQRMIAAATTRATPLEETEVAAHLGDMLLRGGREAEAEEQLRRALGAAAPSASAHVSMGLLRLKQGRLGEATRHLREAAALDSSNHLARFYLADALRREGVAGVVSAADFDEKTRLITAELRRSIELAPDFLEAYKLFAQVELERGDRVDEAAALLERAVGLAPRRREFLLLLAQARVRTREFAAARELVAAATRRTADRRLLGHAEKLLNIIAAREEDARKAEAEAAQAASASGEPAQPCDMPDPGPYHKRLRFKGQQVCGQLVQIECEGEHVVLSIAAGERTLRLRGDALSRIRFVTYTAEVKTGHLSCGPRAPANHVLVTYRARKEKDGGDDSDGEVIAVEFVPADWNR